MHRSGRALTPAFRAGSLYPLARGCRRIWRGEGGSGRLDLDLDLSISGPRASLLHQLHRVREGAAGQAVARCYGVARPREGSRQNSINKAIADQSPLLRLSL